MPTPPSIMATMQPVIITFRAAAPTPKDRTVYRINSKGGIVPYGNGKGTTNAVFSPGCTAVLPDIQRYQNPAGNLAL